MDRNIKHSNLKNKNLYENRPFFHHSLLLAQKSGSQKLKKWKTKTREQISILEKTGKSKILRIKILYGDQPPFSATSTKTLKPKTDKYEFAEKCQ